MSGEKPLVDCRPPQVCCLSAKDGFNNLTLQQQLYAHHMARAAWHGTRIILCQVSPESITIFDLILELHRTCSGDWSRVCSKTGVPSADMQNFLEYAATFLSNVGNYYGNGDQKFVPRVPINLMQQLSSASTLASELYNKIEKPMMASQPCGLGYPCESLQSSYYPGEQRISPDDVDAVSQSLEAMAIAQENTRIQKSETDGKTSYSVLQASVELDEFPTKVGKVGSGLVHLIRGEHGKELGHICDALEEAQRYAANPLQERYICELRRSFTTGDMEPYKESQRLWVKDLHPAVETVFGFVEPYRDPFGVRAEFEGLVAIVDNDQTILLEKLVKSSPRFIQKLPWCGLTSDNDGKGPFEKASMDSPDFTSLHTIAYCSSIIFPGINLPNYNDIRQEVGFKNVMITNSMMDSHSKDPSLAFCLPSSEKQQYLEHMQHTFYLWVVFHELFGHGTGKLLTENEDGSFNFDVENRPINPFTRSPITSWYRPGQTWTGLFGDIATSVDECRAECVGAYLMSEKELLALCGYTAETEVTASDMEYNMYLQLGVAGLRSLENYLPTDNKWGQAHSRGHFAIFRTPLAAGGQFMTVTHDKIRQQITVTVDRAKIPTHGRPALQDLLLRLHMFRCTADVTGCRTFYEDLTEPTTTFLEWRHVVLLHKTIRKVYVQPNTFLVGDEVVFREYENTVEGVIQSWAERCV